MQINSVAFPLSLQINKKKYAKTIIFFCAVNKLLAKYQPQGIV